MSPALVVVACVMAGAAGVLMRESGQEPSCPTGWSRDFGANSSFGDPIRFALPYASGSVKEYLAVLVWPGDEPSDAAARLVAIEPFTGSIVWNAQVAFTAALQSYSGWVDYGLDDSGSPRLYTATITQLLSFDARDGGLVWAVPLESLGHPQPPVGVPAHPTYFRGRIFYTFESGVNSSQMVVANATDGRTLWVTQERVVTLVWAVEAPGLVVYVGQDQSTGDVSVVARTVDGVSAWTYGPLSWTSPGLWDNPNVDVDSEGARVFVYQKPHIGLREVHALNATTGTLLWTVRDENAQYITDYDTYAYDGSFFRLMTQDPQTIVMQRLSGATGASTWSRNITSSDTNAILLVSGGMAFSFGLSTSEIVALSASTGSLLWSKSLDGAQPFTGVTAHGDDGCVVLAFGLSNGSFQVIRAAP
jgi:outer membrane protein assembly factor BamB